MSDIAHLELIRERKEPARRVHWGTGLVAVDEEHQTIGFAVDAREHRLIAKRQTRRRLEIYRVNAAKELPLVRRELAVVADDRGAHGREIHAVADEFRAERDPWQRRDSAVGPARSRGRSYRPECVDCDDRQRSAAASPATQYDRRLAVQDGMNGRAVAAHDDLRGPCHANGSANPVDG